MRKHPREMIEKYPSVKKIYEAIAGSRRLGSEGTVENYVNAVSLFTEFLGYSNPETALKAMLNGEVDAGEKVDAFIGYALDDLGKSHSTVRSHAFGVKKWFELNGVKVDWAKIEMPTGTETREEDRAPTKEDLKTLLNHASSSRDRAVIFIASSSGLRIGTLLSLKVGDIDFSYPDVASLTVERKRGRKFGTKRARSSGKFFATFITPEAKDAVKQYLAEREASGEKLTPESPLIADSYHKGEFQRVEGYERVWARLLRRAGLGEKSQSWYKLHIHTLRKYFRSNCIGVDASYRERWMGHKGLYLDASYFKAEENLHLNEYRKAVPYLTIYAVPTEEKKLKTEMLLNFAKLQGYGDEQLRRLEDILARAKDMDEAITEFRRLKDEGATSANGNGKHIIAKGEPELLQKLNEGYSLVQSLNEDRFLLQKP
ncbi:site-specific integrase [Candidatus Bathyarchaeota archaeon]|nr:site-specific integrase [Candidatus Bathyarchaeota archaeon]